MPSRPIPSCRLSQFACGWNTGRFRYHEYQECFTPDTHLMLAGKWERGFGLVEKAMGRNPYHPNWYYPALSLYHLHGRHYPEALTSINRFAALDFFPFQVNLAVIHGYFGNEQEAHQALGRMFDL